MEVIIDYRELQIKKILNEDNITYENLQVGDIQIKKIHGENNKDILIVERKTFNDLKSSLTDGRFSEQKKRLLSTQFANKAYIFEGDLSKLDSHFRNILTQIVIRIQFKDKMSVFFTGSIHETISLIKQFKRKLELDSKLYDPTANYQHKYVETIHVCKKNNLTPLNCFIIQISQIPGISKITAQHIVEKYKNWAELINAIKDKSSFITNLKNAKIGNKKYQLLYDYII
mgnify:CR=1 FL=1